MFWSIAYKGSLIQGAVLAPSSERIVVQFTKHWPKYTVQPGNQALGGAYGRIGARPLAANEPWHTRQ